MNKLSHTFFMAPMAEVTTPALRKTVRDFGGDVVLATEMLSAGALVAGGMHNRPMSELHPFDSPIIVQIAGSESRTMKEACRLLDEKKPYSIDINMGCAAPDVLKKGYGAALLTHREKAREIVRACRGATRTLLSVKMRAGFDAIDLSWLEDFVTMLQDEGVDFITLHPRAAKMGFRRTADWSVIARLKEKTAMPVIGNGDIHSAETALERLRSSGCDGVMIGREAVKSPWIFLLCQNLQQGTHKMLEINVRDVWNKTLDAMKEYLPEHLHRSRSHRFCQYYSRNVTYGHELFTKIRKEGSIDAIMRIVDEYFARNEHEKVIRAGT